MSESQYHFKCEHGFDTELCQLCKIAALKAELALSRERIAELSEEIYISQNDPSYPQTLTYAKEKIRSLTELARKYQHQWSPRIKDDPMFGVEDTPIPGVMTCLGCKASVSCSTHERNIPECAEDCEFRILDETRE